MLKLKTTGCWGDAGNLAEPSERLGNLGVMERAFEDAVTGCGHSLGDADQFGRVSRGSWNKVAVNRFVQRSA